MAARPKTLNAVIGDVVRGEFTKHGLTLEQLAERTNIPYGTLRKKIIGTSPIHVTELVTLVAAIGPEVTVERVIDDAQAIWERMSSASATTDALTKKRLEKEAEARAMTPDQLAEAPHAATDDPELGTDEPN